MKLTTLLLSSVLLTTHLSAAQSIRYEYDFLVTGTRPATRGPWLTATFTDISPNTVKFDFQSNLNGSEFVSKLGLNVNSTIDVSKLQFSVSMSSGTFGSPSLNLTSWNAGAGTTFDLGIDFDIAPPKDRFNSDDTIQYVISYSGSETFTAQSFFNLDKSDRFYSIAHIQGVGKNGEDSGWVAPYVPAIPEPRAALLGGIGMLALLRRRR